MKLRYGFVSNSSSSSFVCQTCNTTHSGWDCSPRDFDHQECRNGHIFCNNYLKDTDYDEDVEKFTELDSKGLIPDNYWDEDGYIEKYGLGGDDLFDGLPEKYCPLCRFQTISSDDALSYIYKKYNITIEEVKKQIKEQFSSYKDFVKYLQEPSK